MDDSNGFALSTSTRGRGLRQRLRHSHRALRLKRTVTASCLSRIAAPEAAGALQNSISAHTHIVQHTKWNAGGDGKTGPGGIVMEMGMEEGGRG